MLLRPIRQNLRREQGVVILVALFVVALVATMAYVMMGRLARDTQRTSLIVHHIQAEFYARSALLFAIERLRNNAYQQQLKLPVILEKGYNIVSTIRPQAEADHFLVITDVALNSQHVVYYTRLKREVNAGKTTFNIVWQYQGIA